MKYSNLIYFGHINTIGGVETWLYNLSCIYRDRDLTIIYRSGDSKQINRLSQNCRTIRWDGKTKFYCDNLFVCFNTEILPFVKFKKSYLVLHGDYEDMVKRGQLHLCNIPKHELIDEYIGVSQTVCDSWERLTGIKATLCYNPVLEIAQKRKIMLCSAQRMSNEKGGQRIIRLANEMKKYCQQNGCDFEWHIYTNTRNTISAPNIVFKEQRLDISDLYKEYDWFVALSDNEGYCYSVVENLIRGIPCIVTDIPVFKELGLNETNSLRLDLDMGNVDDVVWQIFEKRLHFDYSPPKDRWGEFFTKEKKNYRKGESMLHKVVALDTYERLKVNDKTLGKVVPKGFEFEVDDERLEVLLGDNPYRIPFVKEVKEAKEHPVEAKEEETEKTADEEVKPKKSKKKKVE